MGKRWAESGPIAHLTGARERARHRARERGEAWESGDRAGAGFRDP